MGQKRCLEYKKIFFASCRRIDQGLDVAQLTSSGLANGCETIMIHLSKLKHNLLKRSTVVL